MTTNKTMKLSEAIAALERGEEVEAADKNCITWENLSWGLLEKLGFCYAKQMQFRLKQKPMEIWVNLSSTSENKYAFASEELARRCFNPQIHKRVAVHFREVIESTDERPKNTGRIWVEKVGMRCLMTSSESKQFTTTK